jgi:Protein of unknown function (DUF4230)
VVRTVQFCRSTNDVEICSGSGLTRLDSAKTRVYSRQTGLLVPTDPNLETQVRQEAERQMQEAALADGILRTAQQNAASTIRSLLQGLGFEKIDFD